ncbi:MAG: sulfotransferase family protein [Acidobacteria bacterium]|nr:sulfotransferase family protein [Acidobacteriota bacterium]
MGILDVFRRRIGGRAGGPPIVVVSGLPRSGTSMLMRMLSAGGLDLVIDGLRTADDDNPNGYFELERVKDLDKPGDASWLAEARGKGVKVISALLPHLPADYDYKVVFVRRNLPEVLASQRKMLERRGEAADAVNDDDMTAHFTAHLRRIEAQLAARPHCDVLYVEHRRAVTEPAAVAEEVGAFVGGDLDVAAMAGAVDAKLYRNRA